MKTKAKNDVKSELMHIVSKLQRLSECLIIIAQVQ